jgi:hypothetical protein
MRTRLCDHCCKIMSSSDPWCIVSLSGDGIPQRDFDLCPPCQDDILVFLAGGSSNG